LEDLEGAQARQFLHDQRSAGVGARTDAQSSFSTTAHVGIGGAEASGAPGVQASALHCEAELRRQGAVNLGVGSAWNGFCRGLWVDFGCEGLGGAVVGCVDNGQGRWDGMRDVVATAVYLLDGDSGGIALELGLALGWGHLHDPAGNQVG
jgi:hypothetical protein